MIKVAGVWCGSAPARDTAALGSKPTTFTQITPSTSSRSSTPSRASSSYAAAHHSCMCIATYIKYRQSTTSTIHGTAARSSRRRGATCKKNNFHSCTSPSRRSRSAATSSTGRDGHHHRIPRASIGSAVLGARSARWDIGGTCFSSSSTRRPSLLLLLLPLRCACSST